MDTNSLPGGVNLRIGRFFSGVGYLNAQHAHTWDFVDNPLAYQALLGGQYNDDGLQMTWLAPTDQFVELGGKVLGPMITRSAAARAAPIADPMKAAIRAAVTDQYEVALDHAMHILPSTHAWH